MANLEIDKKKLVKEMKAKNLSLLSTDNGLSNLMIYNHENFAYRYLETSSCSNIKCQFKDNKFWVRSIEPDIYTALKWGNKVLKPRLIELCKKFPGKESSKIQVQLRLETRFFDEQKLSIEANINWDFPSFSDKSKEIANQQVYEFNDLLELRNKHAAWLEAACEIF